MNKNQKITSRCPYCRERIPVGERPKIGKILVCGVCDEQVEIIRLDPVVLDLVYLTESGGNRIEEYEFWDTYWEGV